ncbi:restriction endonuclease [Propionibacterium freudenreichii]|nr:restriction endonuclease [Propionibacterium freudenreichii]
MPMSDELPLYADEVSVNAQSIVDLITPQTVGFAKFLSANDTGETGGHQSGFLVTREAGPVLLPLDHTIWIDKSRISIQWLHANQTTDSMATWYTSKQEFRITGGINKVIATSMTGDLLIMVRVEADSYVATCLGTEADINYARDSLSLSPTATDQLVRLELPEPSTEEEMDEDAVFAGYTEGLTDFPETLEVSRRAREFYAALSGVPGEVTSDPDKTLLAWVDAEYRLFRFIEQSLIFPRISEGFESVDDFVKLANSVKNRRAARAGASLENHTAEVLNGSRIMFTPQARTELNKIPDFLFPDQDAYHDEAFPSEKLAMLAVKTTCKDRWRQVESEADRIGTKHLLTLQKGISANQMKEMQSAHIQLVVPKPYIDKYPRECRPLIWTVKQFVEFARSLEH